MDSMQQRIENVVDSILSDYHNIRDIDKIDVSGGDPTLEDFYESMGLTDEEDED